MLSDSIPTSPAALTSEWLTHILRQAGALTQAAVLSFDMESMPNANGQLVRLTLHYDRSEHDRAEPTPNTIVAKFPSANAKTRTFWTQKRLYEQEVIFYQQIAKVSPIRTPTCYYAAINVSSGNSLLLLEDLTPSRTRAMTGLCSEADAAIAIHEIAKLHAYWWDSPRLHAMTMVPSLDRAQYQDIQNGFLRDGIAAFVAKIDHLFAHEVVEAAATLIRHLPSLAQLGTTPLTFIHYDFHVGNLIFSGRRGEVPFAVVDWELFRKGRGPHDVARLLGLNMAAEDRRTAEPSLLQLYHATLVEHGVSTYSFDACVYDYRMASLDCFARALLAITSVSMTPDRMQKVLQCGGMVLDLQAVELLYEAN